jgi:NAD-dependent dihydropyrimidine dehydrogenase PreA subunit
MRDFVERIKCGKFKNLWLRFDACMPKVKVDWSKCNGDGVCVEICPVNVFELKKLPEYPDTQKSVPVRESDCIACMACVTSCPTQAITVEE